MTVTYDITNSVGQVRLKIGDTDITNNVFTDEELEYFLGLYSSNINLASADALDAWAAKYATNADSEKIGDYSYSQKIFDKLTSKANDLRNVESSTPVLDWAEMDLTDGSGITAEED